MEKEKNEEGYREYLTATENETLVYLEEIKSAAKLRNCEHIKLLSTDLKCYLINAATNRKHARNKAKKKLG